MSLLLSVCLGLWLLFNFIIVVCLTLRPSLADKSPFYVARKNATQLRA